MATNERMSTLQLPDWWLRKATAAIQSPGTNQEDIARVASAHAGRKKPWGSSAITRFVRNGVGRTVALTNGISHALNIPPPFFVAIDELAAIEMNQAQMRAAERAHKKDHDAASSSEPGSASKGAQSHSRSKRHDPTVIDRVADGEILAAVGEAKRSSVVQSAVDAEKDGRGVRRRGTAGGR